MKKITIIILAIALMCGACEKFLDEKSDIKLAIPENLGDLQGLLDRSIDVNFKDPASGEESTDDYFLTDPDYLARTYEDRNRYSWARSFIYPPEINDWFYISKAIYLSNAVLTYIEDINVNSKNSTEWRSIKGQAAFLRAKNQLVSLYLWSPAYDQKTAKSDLGMPLRTGVDFNLPSKRSSVEESYNQVISDLKLAISHLPKTAVHVMRPSKLAAYALLARTYWSMRNYPDALKYADSCLTGNGELLDYNLLNEKATYPISQFNGEVLYEGIMGSILLNISRAKIDPGLLALYDANDLRKSIFFRNNNNGSFGFRGSYTGSSNLFSGISNNEIYLIRAECLARNNQLNEATNDLNHLLRKRYKTNTFKEYSFGNGQEALAVILLERRKELLMRSLRWIDVKRLNKEGANIDFSRTIEGKKVTLKANSTGFTLPIPEMAINLSGMQQNP